MAPKSISYLIMLDNSRNASKISGKLQATKGDVKQGVGAITDSTKLKLQGVQDRVDETDRHFKSINMPQRMKSRRGGMVNANATHTHATGTANIPKPYCSEGSRAAPNFYCTDA